MSPIRDAMRAVIHAGGISFLIGTLLGDFTGAGALVIGSKFLLATAIRAATSRRPTPSPSR